MIGCRRRDRRNLDLRTGVEPRMPQMSADEEVLAIREPLHRGRDAFHGVRRCVTHSKSSWTGWNPSLPARAGSCNGEILFENALCP
jgi:hypothetical protein